MKARTVDKSCYSLEMDIVADRTLSDLDLRMTSLPLDRPLNRWSSGVEKRK